jgi:hypothetical protein
MNLFCHVMSCQSSSYRKVQLESMSQVYEDLNVTYQREKRSREKLDEENKKYQAIMKQSEEEKLQYLALNENLKKDLLFTQESSRQNEVCLVIYSLTSFETGKDF